MKTKTITIHGVTPLIVHNGQLADPLNEHTQALARLTSKRKKTLDDHREISRHRTGAPVAAPRAEATVSGGLNPRRKLTCPSCKRRVGVTTKNGKTRLARHRPTEGKVPGELPGHYQRCDGSGTVVASL